MHPNVYMSARISLYISTQVNRQMPTFSGVCHPARFAEGDVPPHLQSLRSLQTGPLRTPLPLRSTGRTADGRSAPEERSRRPVSPEEQKRGACRRLEATGTQLQQAGWHSIPNTIKSQHMVYYKEHESKCTDMGSIFRVACQFRCRYFACNSRVFYCTRLVPIDNLCYPLYTDNVDCHSIP